MAQQAAPRSHRSRAAVQEKMNHLKDAHVYPLNDMVRELNESREDDGRAPWFDPADAGINAKVLFLLECPSMGGPSRANESLPPCVEPRKCVLMTDLAHLPSHPRRA